MYKLYDNDRRYRKPVDEGTDTVHVELGTASRTFPYKRESYTS